MNVCEKAVEKPTAPPANWSPICCRRAMHQLVRRMTLLINGEVVFSSAWNCGECGRLLL